MPQLVLPLFNPNILRIGPIELRWYSLAYVVGFLMACGITRRLSRTYGLGLDSESFYDDFMVHIIVGVVVGGRLGYVLFYGASYFLAHPLEIFELWHGGMSFHGGLLGVLLASLALCRKHGVAPLLFLDLLAVASPPGLFLGRMANFINLELYGRPSDLPWAMVFPTADELPRHPSQIYEALLEGLVIFVLMVLVARSRKFKVRGLNSGLFLILYGIFRIFVETLREPDPGPQFLPSFLTLGQLLSVPLVLAGVVLLSRALAQRTGVRDNG
ncbi:MAG: prolipoprotein diacylglyceryl transferase [Rickettsiales bacterium]|jgi:phosphatidylglycerol:prolipoprotein diacylglycerol transferase|nr:prolipoprotein diacylglyceryl transferase [Rickettsiales bacterium]